MIQNVNINNHQRGRPTLIKPLIVCLNCGKSFPVYPHVQKENRVKFCSRLCWKEYKKSHYNPSSHSMKIVNMRKINPCATLEQIGIKNNVSRERVRQILDKANLPTRHYIKRTLYTCLNCGKETTNKHGFCSLLCRKAYNTITLVCDGCGRLFPRKKADVLTHNEDRGYKGHCFCSHKCQLEYYWSHPHSPRRVAIHKQKYDYELVKTLYLQNKSGEEIKNAIGAKSTHAVYQIINYLRKLKLITPPVIKKYDYDLIEQLYLENKPLEEIRATVNARSIGVISAILTDIRKHKNIKKRPQFNAYSNRDITKEKNG